MPKVVTVMAAALMAVASAAEPAPMIPCDVTGITDGDSFSASCRPWPGWMKEARVRVLSIDTPERGHRAACDREALLAEEARQAAEEMLSGPVLLTIEGRDSFGRILAHVTLPDGRDYGSEMLEAGLALPYSERERGWCP